MAEKLTYGGLNQSLNMNNTIHFATDEYCFVESPFEGTPEEALAEYARVRSIQKGGFGVTVKEFNGAIDLYMTENTGNLELYQQMSKEQQSVFQEIKKSMKRLEAKRNK